MNTPDHDSRTREPRQDEYHLEWRRDGQTVGLVTCYKPGIQMIDMYRTQLILAKDVQKDQPCYPKTP